MLKFRKKQDNLEYEFMPAALEITETPASPLGRIIIWLIVGIILLAIVWSCIGEIDEVAVARGKVIPLGRVKVVQPLEEGVVTSIKVSEGEQVKEGQILVELDTSMTEVDADSLRTSIATATLEKELLLKAINGGDIEELVAKSTLPADLKSNLLQQAYIRNEEFAGKLQAYQVAKNQSLEQVKQVEVSYQGLKDKVAIIKENEQIYKNLYDSGAVPKMQWLEKYNELALAENELKAYEINVTTAKQQVQAADINLQTAVKQQNSALMGLVVQKDTELLQLKSSLEKIETNIAMQTITSPVSGTIQGLAINTIGGVVTPAQPIMTIVPEGTTLIVEANLLNKDIGFVNKGHKVTVKFDTFPFQKYGAIDGVVESISPDAVEDERLGTIYPMKISLTKNSIMVKGEEVPITPGMAVSAEIKTGRRKVIEFFLAPIMKYADESLKLR